MAKNDDQFDKAWKNLIKVRDSNHKIQDELRDKYAKALRGALPEGTHVWLKRSDGKTTEYVVKYLEDPWGRGRLRVVNPKSGAEKRDVALWQIAYVDRASRVCV